MVIRCAEERFWNTSRVAVKAMLLYSALDLRIRIIRQRVWRTS